MSGFNYIMLGGKNLNIEISEIIEHEIQLKKVELVRVNCECNGKEMVNKESKTNINVNVKSEIVNEKSGYSYIHITVINDEEGFHFEILQRGLFVSINDMTDKKDEFDKFLAIQGIRIMWSYVRESLYDISCRMIGKPFILPTLDVMKTLSNVEEKEE